MKREEQRIFPGGLNLLTPSDKTPEGDAIDFRNWRVDSAGELRGADTFWRLGRAPNGQPVHSVYKLDDFSTTQAYTNGIVSISFGSFSTPQYSVSGAFLVGAGTALYYWRDGSFVTLVASGLSGKRLSIVVWNGFIWVHDPLQQLKIDPAILTEIFPGTAVTPWLPDIPGSSITAVANTSGDGPLVGDYTYYCTYVTFAAPESGGFLTPYESAPGPGVTISSAGGANAILGLPYAAVGAIRLYRQSGSGSSTFLKQFGNGLDPTGAYCLTALTSTYPSNDTPWVDTIATPSAVLMPTSGVAGAPAAPGTAPIAEGGFAVDASAGAVGTYQYYRTFVNSAGLETNPGPVSAEVTPSNGLVDLTWDAPPAGQDIVRQRLYREGGTLGNAYQVIEFADATTTSYTDGAPDLQLTLVGIEMPTTNDPPPSGVASDDMGIAGPYFNVLAAWKNGRMYWSQNGIPLFPASQDNAETGNWTQVGLPDDSIKDMTLHTEVLAIYKQRTVWTVYGDIVTGQLTETEATSGIIDKGCVTKAGGFDLALGPDGVYRFDMYAIKCASDKLAPVFMGKRWLKPGFSDIVAGQRGQDLLGTPQYPFACYQNGTAVLGNGGGSPGDIIGAAFLYHPEIDRWASFTSNFGIALTTAIPFGNKYTWFAGDAEGYLLMSRQVAGTAPSVWQTRFLDQGLGDQAKDYQEVVIDAELNGATMNVWLLFNATDTAGPLSSVPAPYKASFTGTSRQKFYMPLPDDWGDDGPYHISVRTEIDPLDPTGDPTQGGNVPPAVQGLYIYWSLEERDASIRSTQVLDFSSERVQMAQRFEADTVGQFNIEISTDLPDGLSPRFTFDGPESDRDIYEFRVPPNLRGRLWRLRATPQGAGTPTGRVYSIRAWMREVGTAQPEAWGWKEFIRGADAETPEAD
jgi:hypothetical protein